MSVKMNMMRMLFVLALLVLFSAVEGDIEKNDLNNARGSVSLNAGKAHAVLPPAGYCVYQGIIITVYHLVYLIQNYYVQLIKLTMIESVMDLYLKVVKEKGNGTRVDRIIIKLCIGCLI